MKKIAFCLGMLLATSGASLFAAPQSTNGSNGTQQPQQGQMMQGQQSQQGQMMNQAPDCSQLTTEEQNFAAQVMDMNNKTMFCSQFSTQQRQQAMQMMSQPDASGKMMTADQAVQQVMGSSGTMTPSTQIKPRSGGGCPVK